MIFLIKLFKSSNSSNFSSARPSMLVLNPKGPNRKPFKKLYLRPHLFELLLVRVLGLILLHPPPAPGRRCHPARVVGGRRGPGTPSATTQLRGRMLLVGRGHGRDGRRLGRGQLGRTEEGGRGRRERVSGGVQVLLVRRGRGRGLGARDAVLLAGRGEVLVPHLLLDLLPSLQPVRVGVRPGDVQVAHGRLAPGEVVVVGLELGLSVQDGLAILFLFRIGLEKREREKRCKYWERERCHGDGDAIRSSANGRRGG